LLQKTNNTKSYASHVLTETEKLNARHKAKSPTSGFKDWSMCTNWNRTLIHDILASRFLCHSRLKYEAFFISAKE
jgi:hypothetical protein